MPISQALLEAGFAVYGVDASPSMIAAFRQRFPGAPAACEAAEDSALFGRPFDAVVAWGVLFLLPADAQERLIGRVAGALKPGGAFLFTAPCQACSWPDALTGRLSRSLGAAAYQRLLEAAGLTLIGQRWDAGENHYYECLKTGERPAPAPSGHEARSAPGGGARPDHPAGAGLRAGPDGAR